MPTSAEISSSAGSLPVASPALTTGGVLSRRLRIGAAVLVLLALVPTLFFPLGPDGALFFVSGQKLLQGSVYYRDILDLKPPLIYYFYALAIGLFGDGAVAIRIVDLILQLLTCTSIALLVRRGSGDDLWAALSALLYAVLYVALSANSTAIPESYVGLLGVPMILLVERPSVRRVAGAGALAGVLFILKFPLAAMLGAAGVILLFFTDLPLARRWRLLATLVAGFLAAAALLPLYLVVTGTTDDYLLLQNFLRGYMSAGQGAPLQLVRSMIESTMAYFGEYFSMTMSLLAGAGIVAGLRSRSSLSPGAGRVVRDATICFLIMLLSVIVEGKPTPYRFSRIYPFVAILAALGGVILYRLLSQRESDRGYRLLVVAAFLLFALLFSPLPRYLKHSWGGIVYTFQGSAGYDRLYNVGDAMFTRGELERIAATVNRNRGPGERMLVVSSLAGLVHHYAGDLPPFKIYHTSMLVPDFTPSEWKDSMSAFVLTTRPRFILIQKNDSMPSLSGTDVSGEEAFRRLPGVDALLGREYRLILQTQWFDLHRHEPAESALPAVDSAALPARIR